MHPQAPSYYRAQLDTFRHFLEKELPGHPRHDTGKRNSPLELLKNGFVHPDIKERFDSRVESYNRSGIRLSDEPLSFAELCSFNTWFAMHPEKVAGEEVITTSLQFPIMIKGTREDIVRTISDDPVTQEASKAKRIRIAQAQAAARLKQLILKSLSGTQSKIKIGVREAKRWVREGDMFFVVRSWYRERLLINKVHEPKDDPYTKFIEVGNGTLILDLDNYELIWQE
ncbi:MAG: hypothetical protein U0T82_11830 [Bacteroidales bacterium]